MALKDYVIPSASVKVSGNDDLVLRGLSPAAVVYLMRNQPEALEAAFNFAVSGGTDQGSAAQLIAELNTQFPKLAAMVIATAAGEPEAWPQAYQLPLPVQIEALVKIYELTFVGEDALGNFLGTVHSIMAGTAGLLKASPASSPPSAAK